MSEIVNCSLLTPINFLYKMTSMSNPLKEAPLMGPDPTLAKVRHLKASLTVLIRPGEKLELMPTKTGYRLFAQTAKTRVWREIAREGGK